MTSAVAGTSTAGAPKQSFGSSLRLFFIQRLRLGHKFTLLLAVTFIGGSVLSLLVLDQALQRRAEAEVVAQSKILSGFEDAIRIYTSDELSPLLRDASTNQQDLVLETVPSFATKQIFALIHRDPAYESFQFKAAALNPTNPEDLPDPQEADYIGRFRQDTGLAELSGYRELQGQSVFYSARPVVIESETCLACHSTPQAAPPAMIAQYGSDRGFGWQISETIGARVVYVPAGYILDAAHHSLITMMVIFTLIFACAGFLVNVFLRRVVVRPVHSMSELAAQISAGEMGSEAASQSIASLDSVAARGDELGQSARVLQQMAREVYAREQRLKQEVQALRIEIDQAKKEREVQDIIESDYFRELQEKSAKMRRSNEGDVS